MQPIRRILVAVKTTRGKGGPAVAKAAALARTLGARLELFHALTGPVEFDAFTAGALQKYQDAESARQRKRLETMAAPLRRAGVDTITAVEWDSPPHEAVVRHARRVRADLIVAERHAGQHLARWLLRYTDWELLRQSPVPVLLVKKTAAYRTPRILAAVDPAHAFDKTARLDDSILKLGAVLGAATLGQLHVLHAYVPSIIGMKEADLRASDASQRIVDAAASQAGKRLDKAMRSARLGKLPAAQRHLIPLHPVDAIPRLARRLGCDIVVMGAIARTGLKRIVIGSTAERLLDDLPCDLMIVKPPGFATHVPARVRGPELYFTAPPSVLT
jgi:universal stress protein E